jgi:hypothetical protein
MKPTICSKHKGMLTNGVVSHHDNAQPHMTATTNGKIQKLKLKLLPHQAYNIDFGMLKNMLHRC